MIRSKNIDDLENHCKEAYKDAESIIHGWGHAYRVAEGAKWLVKMKNKSKENQDLAYVAGLLHDIVRPIDEERCHAEASAEKARDILTYFNLQENHISKICKAVKDHRYPKED
ncbi:MAG: HD domain-containing protein [Candidatus Thermoplasmatota archaeon]|nr:HD domain-containing protein [Candidatus Thermoplasmatota archaeon]